MSMVCRLPPKPLPIKFYGFEKVDRDYEAEMVERLQRHTNSSLIATEDVWTPGNPTEIQTPGFVIRTPHCRYVCQKATTNAMATEQNDPCKSYDDVLPHHHISRHPRLDPEQVDRIFRRLQRTHTQSSSLRIRTPFVDTETMPDIYKATIRLHTPGSGNSINGQKNGQEISTRQSNSAEHLDPIQVTIQDMERRQRNALKLGRLCRPTTSSQMKRLGECHFCQQDSGERLRARWCQRGCPNNIGGAEAKEREVQEQRVQRLRQPTKASQGGGLLCGKYTPTPDYSLLQENDVPLISGLERTPAVTEITRRLYRPKTSSSFMD